MENVLWMLSYTHGLGKEETWQQIIRFKKAVKIANLINRYINFNETFKSVSKVVSDHKLKIKLVPYLSFFEFHDIHIYERAHLQLSNINKC